MRKFLKICFGKRGAIHVDWAISMGLFLVYVVLLLILIRPGYYEVYKPESLFTIIDNNFVNNTIIKIKEIQFVVTDCSQGKTITLNDKNRNYKFSEVKLVQSTGTTSLTKDGFQSEPGVNIGNDVNIVCSNSADGYLTWDGNKEFLAISYPREYKDLDFDENLPKYNIECGGGAQSRVCTPKLGAVSGFGGFYREYLDYWADKTNDNLEQVKKNFGFPLDKTFNIKIKTLRIDPNTDIIIEIGDKSKRPEDVNIFAKEFDATLINKYNEREKIKIHIDVW